jgi:hypothetical protein
MASRSSIVRYEMQRVASSRRGPVKAFVGQASRHRVQVPQRSASKGSSGVSATSSSRSPTKKNEP